MKTLLSISAIIAISAMPAIALTAEETARLKVQKYAHGADVSSLSRTQIAALMNVIGSEEGESEKKEAVASLVRAWK
ncbi:hypothetical protein ROJ8625_00305 [Roseivivax jejudonensis]|uniref:Uncharacterized protein n=1 Tax=Roseivivax jejudonensis TaxID=1529041 RepID=A0A1X6Y6U0_9RHOB|nr:hypothetical protein [Roseivivax jejudonensis]SLN12057.1 hypothetical protein ROJ8625_00305 [Roseivivax jejudonensis]